MPVRKQPVMAAVFALGLAATFNQASAQDIGAAIQDVLRDMTAPMPQPEPVFPEPVDYTTRFHECVASAEDFALSQQGDVPTARQFYAIPANHAAVNTALDNAQPGQYDRPLAMAGALRGLITQISMAIANEEKAACDPYARLQTDVILPDFLREDIGFRIGLDARLSTIVRALADDGNALIAQGAPVSSPDSRPPLMAPPVSPPGPLPQ